MKFVAAFPRLSLSLLIVPSLLLTGCGGSSSSSGGSSDGSFSLSVTDAPVDGASAVVVEFTGVTVKPADGDAIEFTFDTPKSIDLLAQQNGNSAELVSDEDLPTGSYNWIRLAVNAEQDNVMDSYIEIDGTQHELDVPSGSQRGLQLNSGFSISASSTADYTIDFVLSKSIVLANGDYKLKPSLRLVDNLSDASISGEVDATLIANNCADANDYAGSVYVFSGAGVTPDDNDDADAEAVTTAAVSLDTDAEVTSYRYTAAFLDLGEYTLAYTCDTDEPETSEDLTFLGTADVTLTAGESATLDF